MVRIHRPAVDVGAYRIASSLLALDQRVMVALADCLSVVEIEEQSLIAFVRDLVIDDRCLRMVAIALDDQASAPLAGP